MKPTSVILFLLSCTSINASAADPVTQPMSIPVQKLANVCEFLKGDPSAFGRAVNKQCQNRKRADFDAIKDEKPLKDCIKPGNVIDDDVRKCMKGI